MTTSRPTINAAQCYQPGRWHGPRTAPRQRGVALVAVLWLVAALSIFVASLTNSVKKEAQITSASRELVVGQAIGEGAIQMMMQELSVRTPLLQNTGGGATYSLGGRTATVEVQPLNGLINLNLANADMLAPVFAYAGVPNANAFAIDFVKWRDSASQTGRTRGIGTVEDLLQVPGFDYDAYAKISPFLTAGPGSSGRINPMTAPPQVLAMLTDGNVGKASAAAAQRGSAENQANNTFGVNGNFVEFALTKRFRLRAQVRIDNKTSVIVERVVFLGLSTRDGSPWQTLDARQQLLAAAH